MSMYQYEQQGLIIDVYGRFAIAIGFNMTGKVLVRAESLCLRLKTNASSQASTTSGIFDRHNGEKTEIPNLALILTVGDKVVFDAKAVEPMQDIRWIATTGSLKLEKVCTDTKTYQGYGNVTELNPERGVVSFADKRILFNKSASFPTTVKDLTYGYRLGDMVFFVANGQADIASGCQWRAISVEKYTVARQVQDRVVVVRLPPAVLPQPPLQQRLFFPPPQSFSPTPLPEPMSVSPPEVHRQSSAHLYTPPRRDRSRSPIRRNREPPVGFDIRMFNSLPERLVGYGRVTQLGHRCGLLKDIDSNHLVFFYNDLVTYQSRCKTRSEKPFGVGRVVYFEAIRSRARLNLRAFYDAKRIEILDSAEEAKMQTKFQHEGRQWPVNPSQALPFLRNAPAVPHRPTNYIPRNGRNGHMPMEFMRNGRNVHIKEQQAPEVDMDSSNGNACPSVTSSPPNPETEEQVHSANNPFSTWISKSNSANLGKPQNGNNDQGSDKRVAKSNGFAIDTRTFDLHETEKVKFDRKPTNYGALGAISVDNTEQAEHASTSGTTRRCVLKKTSVEEEPDDFEEFMNIEENFAQRFEFADDDF